MSINPSFFANSSGIGPQTTGFNPTPADSVSSTIRQNSSMGLYEYSLYNDARTRALTGLLATGIAGNASQASQLIKNTPQGQLLKDIAALAVSAGLVPGGSPTQLAANVQQMVATQGFNVGGNIGRGSPMFGGGAITDMLSRHVFDAVKNNFFDPVSGLPKAAAHGMDMSKIAEAMGQLTSRGAFRGMEIGDLNKDSKGKYEFKLDKQKMEKVNKVFSDYAGMLKDARQIFGDLPIGELTQNAERLIGTSLRDMGSVSAMRNRMANIQATSAAFGLNPAAVADRMMSVTDSLQMTMFAGAMRDPRMIDPHMQAITSTAFGRTAADISYAAVTGGLRAADSSTAAANLYAAQGRYMPVLGEAEATQALAGTMEQIHSERDSSVTGNVLPALHMLSTGKIKDPALVKRLNDLVSKVGSAGSVTQAAAINQEIAAALSEQGINIDNYKAGYTSAEMLNQMGPEGNKAYSKFLEDAARRRLVEEGTIQLNRTGEDFGLFGDSDAGIENREKFTDLLMDVNKRAQDSLFKAIGANGEINEDALDAAYKENPVLAKVMSKDAFKNIVSTMALNPDRQKGDLREQLTTIADTMRASSRVQAVGSDMDRVLADERAVQAYLSTTSLGGGINPESFGTELMRGFFGTGKIDEQVVLESLRNKKKLSSYNIKAGNTGLDLTGLDLNAESLANLTNTIGASNMEAIAKELGISPDDKEALIAALGTAQGFRAFQNNLGGAAIGVNKDGTLSVANANLVAQETKALETDAMMTAAKRLLGAGKSIGGDLSTVEGREKYHSDVISELTKDDGAKLDELAGKFAESGYGGQEFEALRLMAQSNPNIRKAIRDSANKANAEGGEENYDKYNKLMALDRRLQAANSEGGNVYLGVLEIMSDSMTQLKLFQQGG